MLLTLLCVVYVELAPFYVLQKAPERIVLGISRKSFLLLGKIDEKNQKQYDFHETSIEPLLDLSQKLIPNKYIVLAQYNAFSALDDCLGDAKSRACKSLSPRNCLASVT